MDGAADPNQTTTITFDTTSDPVCGVRGELADASIEGGATVDGRERGADDVVGVLQLHGGGSTSNKKLTVRKNWSGSYTPASQLAHMEYDGMAEDRYNELNQLRFIIVPGVANWEYRYSATANNGRITQMKDAVTGEEVNYTYL